MNPAGVGFAGQLRVAEAGDCAAFVPFRKNLADGYGAEGFADVVGRRRRREIPQSQTGFRQALRVQVDAGRKRIDGLMEGRIFHVEYLDRIAPDRPCPPPQMCIIQLFHHPHPYSIQKIHTYQKKEMESKQVMNSILISMYG